MAGVIYGAGANRTPTVVRITGWEKNVLHSGSVFPKQPTLQPRCRQHIGLLMKKVRREHGDTIFES